MEHKPAILFSKTLEPAVKITCMKWVHSRDVVSLGANSPPPPPKKYGTDFGYLEIFVSYRHNVKCSILENGSSHK
jgi:hypothetical protein